MAKQRGAKREFLKGLPKRFQPGNTKTISSLSKKNNRKSAKARKLILAAKSKRKHKNIQVSA